MEINRIYLGDAHELIKELPRDRKIIIVTDPPFNIGYHYDICKDKVDDGEYYRELASLIREVGGSAVIIHYPEALHRLSIELGKCPQKVCSWVYNSNTPRQHRDIAYYGVKPIMRQMTQPYKNPTDKRIAERISRGIQGGSLYDWYEVQQVKNVADEKFDHPCQMPIKVMENIIGVIPKEDNPLILEPFAGTGTTCLACKHLGYDFIGFEISPKYHQIAVDRLQGWNAKGELDLLDAIGEWEK